jgi:quinol-cytochrome oxidoreductase complex cytochrome b subunit
VSAAGEGTPGKDFAVAQGDDAKRVPVRVVVVQGDQRPAVDASDEPMVMTFPHLIVRELIAFLGLSLALILLALFANAPLEEIADPTRTPNPAKAPWYFLGLQELLHYYPPVVSGVLLPALLIVALAVIPYLRVNLERAPLSARRPGPLLAQVWFVVAFLCAVFYLTGSQPVWPFIGTLLAVAVAITVGALGRAEHGVRAWLRARSLPFWIFAWFLLAAVALTVIGVFFRGPGWRFTLPWRDGVYY